LYPAPPASTKFPTQKTTTEFSSLLVLDVPSSAFPDVYLPLPFKPGRSTDFRSKTHPFSHLPQKFFPLFSFFFSGHRLPYYWVVPAWMYFDWFFGPQSSLFSFSVLILSEIFPSAVSPSPLFFSPGFFSVRLLIRDNTFIRCWVYS